MGEQGGQPALTAAGHGSAEQDRTRKILVSEALRRSGRLKELLVYLLARTAESPEAPVREQEIGVSVYNRSPGYDTSHDTIVRVQVAQLRKKLERYYQTEGASDEVVLTIPRGSYQPVWHPRAEIPVQLSPSSADAPHPKRWLVAAFATILFIAITATLILRRSPDSTVNRFWSQLLVPGKTTNIVLSDPGIVMLAQAMGRPIRFPELGGRLFLSGIEGLNT